MAREYQVRRVQQPWTQAHQNFVVEERRLNLATVARVNLYALPGPAAFPMALGSIVSFLSALRGKWAGRLRIADHVLQAPDYQRKPITEMLGLGVTMDIAREYHWNGRGPESVDALRQYWGKDGNRPDLLFTCVGGAEQFVGEAKGRLSEEVRPSAPYSDERGWLAELDQWYGDFGLQYFLVLAMGTRDRVVANIYDPGEPRQVYPPETLLAAVRSREQMLWDTGPAGETTPEQALAGRAVRGRWVAIPDDGSGDVDGTSMLFLGVLGGDGLERPVELDSDGLQVSGAGRVLVVLRRSADDEAIPEVDSALPYFRDPSRFEIRRGGEAIAWGAVLPNGRFRIDAGSQSRPPQSSLVGTDRRRRRELLQQQVLTRIAGSGPRARVHFAEDCEFSSASAAARMVLGTRADGPLEWRLADGTSLRDLGP